MTLLVFAQIRQRVEKSMNAMLSKSRFQIVARKKGIRIILKLLAFVLVF